MSTGSQKKTRIERVASVELPPGPWGLLWGSLRKGYVLVRLALCLLVAIVLLVITRGWNPPQSYFVGYIPRRDISARTQFEIVDEQATRQAREEARRLAIAVYDQDPEPFGQLRARLDSDVSRLVTGDEFEEVSPLWDEFALDLAEGTPAPTDEEQQAQFDRFREALNQENALTTFNQTLNEIFRDLEQNGLLIDLPAEHNANRERIFVRRVGTEGTFPQQVQVSQVLTRQATGRIQQTLQQKLPNPEVANRVFSWLRKRLPVTLELNQEATAAEQAKSVAEVPDQKKTYAKGTPLAVRLEPVPPIETEDGEVILVERVKPISEAEMALLNAERKAEMAARPLSAKIGRSLAVLGMYVGLYTLCGFYIYHRQPLILYELKRLAILLTLVVVVVGAIVLFRPEWRAEIIPLLLFGMTMAIAYEQALALLVAAAVTAICAVTLGQTLSSALVVMAAAAAAIMLLGRVRSRSKLLSVGFFAAAVAFLTAMGVGTLDGLPFWLTMKSALLFALWAVVAGSLMTCCLPAVEKVFGVQTDLSLIELGDPAHPLLQELIRRAPGTYNHSITVASIAEAAAESIGARGLLVRVGAYFHDIGKMLKPGYFIENQGHGDNRHQSLLPAMSTLVIIAHVKDGADLGRQNGLPQPIIDFIQQHHGTTLVEYFYRQASERKKQEEQVEGEVDESSFRYPGPKPQTKEAGVLMLADAVESASRVLVEPTPARIENLVEDICRKRLLDGQFDECGLTLREVHRIGDSLVKSLTAVYHGRVKYPDQETA